MKINIGIKIVKLQQKYFAGQLYWTQSIDRIVVHEDKQRHLIINGNSEEAVLILML